MNIGKKIRELRKTMNLTQSQFAELVGVSEDSIGKIERGINKPTIDTLSKISEGIKIDLSEVLGETRNKGKTKHDIIDGFTKYLKSKSPTDVALIHKIAVLVLERRKH